MYKNDFFKLECSVLTVMHLTIQQNSMTEHFFIGKTLKDNSVSYMTCKKPTSLNLTYFLMPKKLNRLVGTYCKSSLVLSPSPTEFLN